MDLPVFDELQWSEKESTGWWMVASCGRINRDWARFLTWRAGTGSWGAQLVPPKAEGSLTCCPPCLSPVALMASLATWQVFPWADSSHWFGRKYSICCHCCCWSWLGEFSVGQWAERSYRRSHCKLSLLLCVNSPFVCVSPAGMHWAFVGVPSFKK